MNTDYTLAELAIVAASEIFRDETPEVFVTLIGTLPKLAGYVAKETFRPGMMMSDGIYYLAAEILAMKGSLPSLLKVIVMLLSGLFRSINMAR